MDGTQSISSARHPLARATLAGGWLEDVRSTPTSVSIDRGVTLRIVVKAAIVCRRIIKGTPRAGLGGCTARPQEKEDEAAQDFMHVLLRNDVSSIQGLIPCNSQRRRAFRWRASQICRSSYTHGRGRWWHHLWRLDAHRFVAQRQPQYVSANLRQCRASRRDFATAARRANSLAFAR